MRSAGFLGFAAALPLLAAFPVPDAANTPLWPLPSSATSGTSSVGVTPSADFFKLSGAAHSPLLDAAFARYGALTFPHATTPGTAAAGGASALVLTVADLDESHPQIGLDESYTLAVGADGAATLDAQTVWGALRGLETFSQLVAFDFEDEAYTVSGAPWRITDAPRFPHRGLMMDSARHFQSVASIKAMVASLPYAKLNVLHWHVVDTQSFPFHSETSPKLWDGAYSAQERYTHADIAEVVEFARLHGVRVMVEFDMPGHAQSWCVGYPELCPSATCLTPLDVSRNSTFDLIEGVLGECTGKKPSSPHAPSGLFPDHFIHLGGDEVSTKCWSSTPRIASWLDANKLTADDAYALFVKRTAAIAISQGRRPVQWSEVYDHFKTALPKQVVVHVWKDVTNVTEVVANGYDVIRNVGYDATSWYLDNLDVTWDKVYANEPCSGVPDGLCHKVLGGHGEMWGETVDVSDVQQTVWPRLAAIGEKLWSPREATAAATDDVLARIEAFRCLLNLRGVMAAPVLNKKAREGPPSPDSCYRQRRRQRKLSAHGEKEKL